MSSKGPLQAPSSTPTPTLTLNQSETAAAASAAILSMALAAANMKYHTAKPFFMNIKFRLTISISCTNVSVTKFALGLGQRDCQTARQADRQLDRVKKPRKSIQLPNYGNAFCIANISLSQYLCPQLFCMTRSWLGLHLDC